MSKSERPMINTYECDEQGVERLVYRPMNDEEFEDHKLLVKSYHAKESLEHPLITQVREMSDDERKTLKDLLL